MFEFRCSKCNKIYESISRKDAPFCKKCGIITHRIISVPMLVRCNTVKSQETTDGILNDYHKGQKELSEGDVSQVEIEESKGKMVDRAKERGVDPGYLVGKPKKLSKKELKKKSVVQREEIDRSLSKHGKFGKS